MPASTPTEVYKSHHLNKNSGDCIQVVKNKGGKEWLKGDRRRTLEKTGRDSSLSD